MTEKLARRGLLGPGRLPRRCARRRPCGQVMSTPVDTIAVDAPSVRLARARWPAATDALPIGDADGRCVGIVSRRTTSWPPKTTTPGAQRASEDVVSVVPPATSLLDALHLMFEEDVEHLPVIDGDRLVGMCTRTDIFAARRRQLSLEQRRTGLGGRLRRRRASCTAAVRHRAE